MSSKDFQPFPQVGGGYRRLAEGWSRLRVQGHLFEAPHRVDGFKRATDMSQAIHVEDCPKCVMDAGSVNDFNYPPSTETRSWDDWRQEKIENYRERYGIITGNTYPEEWKRS